jgi:hypothetical protein
MSKIKELRKSVQANSLEQMCESAQVTKSEKTTQKISESVSSEISDQEKQLSATAILKANVSTTLAAWNKMHVCSALFANISAKKIDTFISVTENCSKYPVKNYDGDSPIIRTEIQDGKDFSFIAFPETLTAANVVTIYNAVCTYDKARKESITNAAENAAKAKQAQIKALQTVISITTDANILSALKSQLEALQK